MQQDFSLHVQIGEDYSLLSSGSSLMQISTMVCRCYGFTTAHVLFTSCCNVTESNQHLVEIIVARAYVASQLLARASSADCLCTVFMQYWTPGDKLKLYLMAEEPSSSS